MDLLRLFLCVLIAVRSRRVRRDRLGTLARWIYPTTARRTSRGLYASCTNSGGCLIRQYGVTGMNHRNYPNRSLEDSGSREQDFDDGADDLWSINGKEAKSRDEARMRALKDDMDGVLIYVCACLLWSAVG
jgi:hypothetical protein